MEKLYTKRKGVIRHIWMGLFDNKECFIVLRMYWDGTEKPSVESLFDGFFSMANSQRYHQMTSAMVCVNPRRGMNCYWKCPSSVRPVQQLKI